MGQQAKHKKARQLSKKVVMSAFAAAATEVLPRYMSPDRCLNASRVAIEALGHFHVAMKPLATFAIAQNRAMWDMANRLGRFPADQAEVDKWAEESGAWAVGVVGEVSGKPGYPCHLVVVGHSCLIDAGAGQFARPVHAINVPEVVLLEYEEVFFHGQPLLVNRDDTYMSYRALPEEKGFLELPGFQAHPENLQVARLVIGEMRKHL